MTTRERFKALLDRKKPDRIPTIEWAAYWDLTINKWNTEGLPKQLDQQGLTDFFGLDKLYQFSTSGMGRDCPRELSHGSGIISTEEEYEAILPFLYREESINSLVDGIKKVKPVIDNGDAASWLTLEGFFWYPRSLLGIENHLFAFYDSPELMHRINSDITVFSVRIIEAVCNIIKPEFMTFAEDMSYNHGAMLSKELFDEFVAPYYHKVIPLLKAQGIKVFIDTDGDVEPLIPWFMECGIDGVLPLERQAGVDVNRIRENYPDWLMIGGYNKLIMHKGAEAMQAEFERLLPAMRSGGYIPGVDHQTPPDVSIENYRIFVRLLQEYSKKATE